MRTQLVEIKDFPGMTLDDALKIATHRLTQNGYEHVEPLSAQPGRLREVPGDWRFESLTRALVDAPEVLVTRRGIGQGRLRLVAHDRERRMPPAGARDARGHDRTVRLNRDRPR